ncbi:MAG: FHA domain-containing protein [Tissierellales bacterium]|nr:FHA domain-containing protein [Tissierellales bacterium]
MFNILSILAKYIFVFIIYMFIFLIIRMIYLDINQLSIEKNLNGAYLKLLNRLDDLQYKLKDSYSIADEITLGRSNDNDIVIKSPYVSKHHFKIVKDEREFYIEDLNSSNGTYINGERIYDARKLKKGDIIKVGELEFMFMDMN